MLCSLDVLNRYALSTRSLGHIRDDGRTRCPKGTHQGGSQMGKIRGVCDRSKNWRWEELLLCHFDSRVADQLQLNPESRNNGSKCNGNLPVFHSHESFFFKFLFWQYQKFDYMEWKFFAPWTPFLRDSTVQDLARSCKMMMKPDKKNIVKNESS